MMQRVPIVLACLISSILLSDAQAQSLQERIQIVREQRNRAAIQDEAPEPESAQIPLKMGKLFEEVFFDQTPARDVFEWWSTATDIPLVIDWDGMAYDGIDPELGITLNLQTVPARSLLDVIIRQTARDADLIYEVTPWYVQVMTKRQANRNPVLRVYDVSDMVMTIPNFTTAPRLDLAEAPSNTTSGSGGGSGGSSGGLFGNEDNNENETLLTKSERGQRIANTIINTIEPDIWQTNGGLHASARYFDGKLIVNAPEYVHRQIGIPVVTAYQPRTVGGHKSAAGGTQAPTVSKPFGTQQR